MIQACRCACSAGLPDLGILRRHLAQRCVQKRRQRLSSFLGSTEYPSTCFLAQRVLRRRVRLQGVRQERDVRAFGPRRRTARPVLATPDRTRGHPFLAGAAGKHPPLTRERSLDVFPDEPPRHKLLYTTYVLEHESRSSLKTFSLSCDGEGLAWTPSDHKVNCSMNLLFPIYYGDVTEVRDVRPALCKYRAREVVYLAERERFPSERFPRERCRLDA